MSETVVRELRQSFVPRFSSFVPFALLGYIPCSDLRRNVVPCFVSVVPFARLRYGRNLRIRSVTDAGPVVRLKLHLMQFSIKTPDSQQFFMRADLADLALVQHNDLVRLTNGGETMGDDD